MSSISVFYQGEGLPDIEHIEADSDETLAAVRKIIREKHGIDTEALLYVEDADEPADERSKLCDHAGRAGVKIHIHRCRKVEVSVSFNGETVERKFSPATTVARVKNWAAEREFGMTPQEAGEHILQISGTQDRPDPGTHLGRLVSCPGCEISFDLVPNERINGAASPAGAPQ